MDTSSTLLIRAESKPLEHRAVVTPSVVARLIQAGYKVKCERSSERCFSDEEMAAAGATLVPTDFWQNAPLDHIIVGLKELNPSDTFPLEHTHLHFAHVFKDQPGWRDVLSRFARGHGNLLDIEFLKDPKAEERLLNPSSFHAGFCGTVLAVQAWARQIANPSDSTQHEARPYHSEQEAIDEALACLRGVSPDLKCLPTVMIVGASGKCGLGAVDFCQRLGLPAENIIECGRKQTSHPEFNSQVLQADILINCIYLSNKIKPFLTMQDLQHPERRLSVVSDVSCDGDDDANPLAVYSGHTSFKEPCMQIPTEVGPPLQVIAIDHFPSLIPRDASEYCAMQMLPYLLKLGTWRTAEGWKMARDMFTKKLREATETSSSSRRADASPQMEALTRSNSTDSEHGRSSNSSVTSLDSGAEGIAEKPYPHLIHTYSDSEDHYPYRQSKLEEALESPTTPAKMDESLQPQLGDAFDTTVVHGGHRAHDPATGAVSMPIVMSSTYAQINPEDEAGSYVYSRKANPNRNDFERSVAVLEKAEYGLGFASGSAAISMIVSLLDPYNNIIAIADAYSGTQRTFSIMAEKLNISTTYVEAADLTADLGKYVSDSTKMVWIESPSNPLLQVIDLRAVASQAHQHGLLVVVDNTVASPYVFNPIVHGADIVVHSATKHLAGHSDLVVGVLVTNSAKLQSQLHRLQNALGAVPSPFDCWLASRGLRTLHLRGARACSNALAVAEALEKSPHVDSVIYPGLESHAQRAIVVAQHNYGGVGGGIVSFKIKGANAEMAERFCRSLRFFTLAESFGSTQSLCEMPGLMTHKLLTSEQRAAIGVDDDLVRLSMGIEAPEDLVADVLQALDLVRSEESSA